MASIAAPLEISSVNINLNITNYFLTTYAVPTVDDTTYIYQIETSEDVFFSPKNSNIIDYASLNQYDKLTYEQLIGDKKEIVI